MRKFLVAMIAVLTVLATLVAAPASAELRSEPWACFARGYILELNAMRVATPTTAQAGSIRNRLKPQLTAAEVLYSFDLYDVARDEYGDYMRYLINVADVDEGFATVLAKAANGELAVELATYGGPCPKNRPLRAPDNIRLLDYDLSPVVMPVPPVPPLPPDPRG